jgi:hypothetical protein
VFEEPLWQDCIAVVVEVVEPFEGFRKLYAVVVAAAAVALEPL